MKFAPIALTFALSLTAAAQSTASIATARTAAGIATERNASDSAAGKAEAASSNANTAAATAAKSLQRPAHRRDPFQSIIRTEPAGPACTGTGKQCLIPNQIILRGIVSGPNGRWAVIENGLKKTYFLRENDPVFHGEVVKINEDSVLFREFVTDRAGRHSVREVVKRVGTTNSLSQARPLRPVNSAAAGGQ